MRGEAEEGRQFLGKETKMKRLMLLMAVALLVSLALVGGASAQNGVVQVAVIIDGSGSVGSSDFDVMLDGLAAAVEDSTCIPHNASVELTVIQFSDMAQTEVGPSLVRASNASNLATQILAISQIGSTTDMADAFDQATAELTGSSRFASAEKQIINLSTDGEPDDDQDAIDARDAAIAAGIDEIDAEAIGTGADAVFLQDEIVYPQPGNLAPPYTPGWVATPDDFDEYADSLCEKFQQIVPPEPEPEEAEFVPEAGTLALLGSGLAGLAGYASLRGRNRK
jgi:uncharacterized protein YegL